MSDRAKKAQELIERFIYDLARLMAGHNPPMDYLTLGVDKTLREAVSPYHEKGYTLDPDFGEKGKVEIVGLEKLNQPIHAKVILSDRSVPINPFGLSLLAVNRDWMLNLTINDSLNKIEQINIEANDVYPLQAGFQA
jgi:hypothetical protein